MNEKFRNKYRIKSSRLPHWDYKRNAAYFITICTRYRENFFGEISNGTMHLSGIGEIAEDLWVKIPEHFPYVSNDEFIVMPDHIHGIIIIDNHDTLSGCEPASVVETVLDGGPISPVETLHATSLRFRQQSQPHQQSQPGKKTLHPPKTGSLSVIIRSYKSAVTKKAREINLQFAWQDRFYDHIIRDNGSFERIAYYIKMNVVNWRN